MTTAAQTSESAQSVLSPERPVAIPEESRSERQIAIAIFAISFIYLYLFRRYTTIEPDEGIILQGAQRVLDGEVLYRDFFSFFTPGSYYFLALIFRLFGSSFLVARTVLVFFGGIYSVVAYLLARRVCSRTSALAAIALMAATTLPFRFLVLHNWDSTLWACLALYCAVKTMESSGWKWSMAAGTFTSLTILFEQSKGAGLALGLLAGFVILAVGRAKARLNAAQIVGFSAGLFWPFLPTLAYFGFHHALGPMLADWLWPLRHYSLANRVPYGYQGWSDETRHSLFGSSSWPVTAITTVTMSPCFLIPVLPLIAVGLLIYWIRQHLLGQGGTERAGYYIVIGSVLSGLLLSVVMVRADILHFMYLQPLFCLVLAWIFDGRDIPGRIFLRAKPMLVAYLLIAFFLFSIPLLLRTLGAHAIVATRRGTVRAPREDTVIPYIQKHVAAGETILVYPYLPLYYYLTATTPASEFEYFQPGMHTAQQAQTLLTQLHSRNVKIVLFESSFAEKIPHSWPQTPLSAIVNDPVADYLSREYRSCQVLRSPADWRFLFMVRKDLPCPA